MFMEASSQGLHYIFWYSIENLGFSQKIILTVAMDTDFQLHDDTAVKLIENWRKNILTCFGKFRGMSIS